MAKRKDKDYDVFLVHSSEDKNVAIEIKAALTARGMKTYAHFDEGAAFGVGKVTVDSIMDAVNASRIVLILMTPNAIKSQWVNFEILLSLERSHREGYMCCRLCMVGISETERRQYQAGELKHIPSVMVDFNKADWADTLLENIKEEKRMEDILPSGNVAVGLVFNYFVGFLQHVLPKLKEAIVNSDFYKANPGRMSQKLFMLLPSSCQAPNIAGGGEGGKPLIEKEGSLKIESGHGDKKRQYNPTVYSVQVEGQKWFFVGECPTIIEAMAKIQKHGFLEIDIRLQVDRFRITLQELVQHRNNKVCNDTVAFITYDDAVKSAQDVLLERIMVENMQTLSVSEKVCYICEACTPGISLNTMANELPFAGIEPGEILRGQIQNLGCTIEKRLHDPGYIREMGDFTNRVRLIRYDLDSGRQLCDVIGEQLSEDLQHSNLIFADNTMDMLD